MTPTEKVSCPICGADEPERVRLSADIVACGGCGVVYLRTRPPVAQLENDYQSYASAPGSHMVIPTTKEQVKSSGLRRDYFMRELLECVGDERGSLFDCGCGWGAFLDNARDNGFFVAGNEICKQMAEHSENVLGIATRSTQLEEVLPQRPMLDVVTALHSLEHLPNQRTALEAIHRALKPGGLFCGIVPNFNSFMSQKQGDRWTWIDANWHYIHLTPETLADTLRRFGFEPVKIYTNTDDFDRKLIEAELAKQNTYSSVEELEQCGMGEAIRWFSRRLL